MPYPEAVDQFVEKLNKADTVYVIQDEELVLENGVFEGELAHDNVKNESVIVFAGPKMSGERIENFFLSIPSNAPWKRVIKVFSDTPKVYLTYETTGDQVEAEDINLVQESIVNTQAEVERYKAANDQAVEGINVRLTTAENNKAERTYVDTELLKKADKVTTYTKTETDDRIQAIIGAAPETLDTLEEIADALNNDPDFAATITNELATKVDKVAGKGLSTEDYTTTEKTKLAGIEAGANKYIHPASHPASMITESTSQRFVSDIEKAAWNAKETPAGAQEKANIAEANAKGYTDEHDQNTTKHITAAERASWNAKQDALGYTPVNKAGDTIQGQLVVNTPDGEIGLKINGGSIGNTDLLRLEGNASTQRFILRRNDSEVEGFLEAGTTVVLFGSVTSHDLRLRTGYSDKMVIKTDGKVGINTLTPSEQLDINGKIRMRIQTSSDDVDDMVATKKYVDTKTAEAIVGPLTWDQLRGVV